MGNISKNFKPAPIFQMAQRGGQSYADLKAADENFDAAGEDMAFESYAIREGEVINFPDTLSVEDAVRIHPTATASGWMWIIPCESSYKGKTKSTWFNVSSLKRQDVNREPMHPEWFALGNLEARVNALAKLGTITGESTAKFDVPKAFVVGDNGRLTPATKEDGTIDTIVRDEVIITNPLAE